MNSNTLHDIAVSAEPVEFNNYRYRTLVHGGRSTAALEITNVSDWCAREFGPWPSLARWNMLVWSGHRGERVVMVYTNRHDDHALVQLTWG